MNDISSKIRTLRAEALLSQGGLAAKAGVSQQLVSQLERGENTSTKHLPKLARALGVDVGDLDPAFKSKDAPYPAGEAIDGDALVSVYDIAASAGYGSLVGDQEEVSHTLAFPPDYLEKLTRSHPSNLAIIGVKGDSMAPTLKDDDIVMIDRSKTNPSYDGLFVLRFGDALHVKRIGRSALPNRIMIISDNHAIYPPQDQLAADVSVIGKVIWTGGKT